jgi:putative Ca2+/H+ antiporter (TMEM165/GDT1 family)
VFAVTFAAFFLAEMGDKTQLATIALSARYPDLVAVVAGTTMGMLIADVPAVLIGEKASARISFKAVRYAAAALFAAMGIMALAGFQIFDRLAQ